MPRRKKIDLMETAAEKIGRMLSDNYGIKVVYAGDMCCTDGKTIFLPVLGDDAPDELLGAFPGLIDHETSHVMDTDFDVFKSLKSEPMGMKIKPILNAVEDARCERYIVERWRGCKVNLNKTAEWGYNKLFEDWNDVSEWGKFVQILNAMMGQDEDHWALRKMEKLEPDLWPYAQKVKHLTEQAANLPSTKASLDLAKEILEHIHIQTDPPPPPQQGNDNGENEDQNDSGNSDDSEATDENEDQSGRKRKENEDQGSQESSQRSSKGNKKDEQTDQAQQNDHPQSLKRDWQPDDEDQKQYEQVTSRQEQVKKAAQATKQAKNRQYLAYTTEGDTLEKAPRGDRQTIQRLLNEYRPVIHVVEKRLMRNLTAFTKCRWECNQERGRINPRALHRIITGASDKVFRKRVEAPKFDTRCSLWIDHSYSMNGNKLRIAAATSIIFGEVLNRLNIPFEVCGYSTGHPHTGQRRYESAASTDQHTYTRWGNLWVRVYKGFEEPWASVKHRCSNMSSSAQANTFDGEAIRLAAKRLLTYPERRRILFAINDGQPYPNIDKFMNIHREYLKDVAASVERAIELFAIGINSETVSSYYSNAVCINSVDDLPKIVVGKLDQLLRKMQQQLMSIKVA